MNTRKWTYFANASLIPCNSITSSLHCNKKTNNHLKQYPLQLVSQIKTWTQFPPILNTCYSTDVRNSEVVTLGGSPYRKGMTLTVTIHLRGFASVINTNAEAKMSIRWNVAMMSLKENNTGDANAAIRGRYIALFS